MKKRAVFSWAKFSGAGGKWGQRENAPRQGPLKIKRGVIKTSLF